MTDVLIRNVPPEVLDALKTRARQHRRSLQQELVAVLEAAARQVSPPGSPEAIAAAIRERLAGSGRVFGDSAELLREDRTR